MALGISRLFYGPFLVQIVVTRRCNLACAYCNEYDQTSPPVSTTELKRRFRKCRDLGAWALEFSGGEPLLHPDIFELTRYAKDLGFHRVMLITNGFPLNEAKVRRLNEAGLDDLQISIDGVEPTASTVKVLKPLRRKIETTVRHARFRVNLNSVVGVAPPEEVREVVEFSRRMGCRPTLQLVHSAEGQLSQADEHLATYQELRRLLGQETSSRDYRVQLMQEGRAPFKCRAGSRYLYVDEEGMVRWCSQQRHTHGFPLHRYGRRHLIRQFYTQKECNEACTVGCVRNCSRYEEWRSQPLRSLPGWLSGSTPSRSAGT